MRLKETVRNPNVYFFLFFFLLFFYYLLCFNSCLYYHYHQPIFLLDKTYIKEFLLYPGGLAEWVTQFLLQFFYFNILGSLLITALSILVFVIIYKIIKEIGDFQYSLILSFLPVCFLLTLQNRYNFPLVITVKYLVALSFFFSYLRIANRYKTFIIIFSCLIYYILGGWTYLFFITLCVLNELLFSKESRKYVFAGLNILVYFIYTYIAARYLFVITLKEACFYMAPYKFFSWPFLFELDVSFYLFFLSLPMLQIAFFIYLKYLKDRIKSKTMPLLRSTFGQSIFIIIFGILILIFSFDRARKKKVQVDYFAEKGKWEELLSVSREMKIYDFLVYFNVNRALYHTGQLLDNLFDYPQLIGSDGLLIYESTAREAAIQRSDLYFDLGLIKAAQVMAYEGETKSRYNPRLLKRIVMASIINEQYIIAKKFLDILDKSIIHKKWVKHYESYLFNDSLIESDSLIQIKRKLTPKFDFFITGQNPEIDLVGLLKENENNRMAFEYLTAYYLLEYRLKDLAKCLGEFKRFGYKKYPRHIEEALLLIGLIYRDEKVKLDFHIDSRTIERFKQLNMVLSHSRKEMEAKKILEEEFHDTYWFYVSCIYPEITKK